MKLIILNGKKYITKSKLTLFVDTVAMLPHSFVRKGLITQNEWANSDTTVIERFNLDIIETNIDGRKKEYKNLPYFTWGVLKN